MAKTLLQTVLTFAKNMGRHAHLVATREETLGEAWAHLIKDARKVKRVAIRPVETPEEREVAQLIRHGRKAYNAHDYEKAEAFFRQAIVTDKDCCAAHTYLGHTLYKQGRIAEAEGSWNRAIDVAPTYDDAEKARQKLVMLERKKKKALSDIQDRVRGNEE